MSWMFQQKQTLISGKPTTVNWPGPIFQSSYQISVKLIRQMAGISTLQPF